MIKFFMECTLDVELIWGYEMSSDKKCLHKKWTWMFFRHQTPRKVMNVTIKPRWSEQIAQRRQCILTWIRVRALLIKKKIMSRGKVRHSSASKSRQFHSRLASSAAAKRRSLPKCTVAYQSAKRAYLSTCHLTRHKEYIFSAADPCHVSRNNPLPNKNPMISQDVIQMRTVLWHPSSSSLDDLLDEQNGLSMQQSFFGLTLFAAQWFPVFQLRNKRVSDGF